MLDKDQKTAAYAAYAELESAAEAFYAAAQKMSVYCTREAGPLNRLCEDINIQVICCDDELDEVL